MATVPGLVEVRMRRLPLSSVGKCQGEGERLGCHPTTSSFLGDGGMMLPLCANLNATLCAFEGCLEILLGWLTKLIITGLVWFCIHTFFFMWSLAAPVLPHSAIFSRGVWVNLHLWVCISISTRKHCLFYFTFYFILYFIVYAVLVIPSVPP